MKLTKGIITRDEAFKINPDYVLYKEGDWDKFEAVNDAFGKLRRGQQALTYDTLGKQWVRVKVTSINHNDFRAVDGPIVRVSNGEYSWRVDGDGWGVPV